MIGFSKNLVIYTLVLSFFTSSLPIRSNQARAYRMVDINAAKINDKENFPDYGNLTRESTLWEASDKIKNTTVKGLINGEKKSIHLGQNAMIPLLAAAKLTTELLLVFRRSHVEYGENFFGEKAIAYNKGKTAHLKAMLKQAYPEKQFPHFQEFLKIQDDKTMTELNTDLASEFSPVGRGQLISYMLDSIMIWDHDRVLTQRANDIPDQLKNHLRGRRELLFTKGTNRMLSGPFSMDHLPGVLNRKLFREILKLVMSYRESKRKSLTQPFLYEALVALSFYQYIKINQAAPEKKNQTAYRSLLKLRNAPNPKELKTLRGILSKTILEDIRSGIFRGNESYRHKQDFNALLTVGSYFHYKSWEVRMKHLNVALLFLSRRRGASFLTMAEHITPDLLFFGGKDLESHEITDAETFEPDSGEELLANLSVLIPIFHHAPLLQNLLAKAYGFKSDELKDVFTKLNAYYDMRTKDIERKIKTTEWTLAALGVGEVVVTMVFQTQFIAIAFLIVNVVLIGQASVMGYFEAIGSIPYLFNSYYNHPGPVQLANVTPDQIDQRERMTERALRTWYMSMGLISFQAGMLSYLRLARNQWTPFSLVPFGRTVKKGLQNIPIVSRLTRPTSPLLQAQRSVPIQELRAIADPRAHNRALEHFKKFRYYDDVPPLHLEMADDAYRGLGKPYYNPGKAAPRYKKLQDLLDSYQTKRIADQTKGNMTLQSEYANRQWLLGELKSTFPKSYKAMRRKYFQTYSWLNRPVAIPPVSPMIGNSWNHGWTGMGNLLNLKHHIIWGYAKFKSGIRGFNIWIRNAADKWTRRNSGGAKAGDEITTTASRFEEAPDFARFIDEQLELGQTTNPASTQAKGFSQEDFYEADGRYFDTEITTKTRRFWKPWKKAEIKKRIRLNDRRIAKRRSKLILKFLKKHPEFKAFYRFLENRDMTGYLRLSGLAKDGKLAAQVADSQERFLVQSGVMDLSETRLTWGNMAPDDFNHWVNRLQEIGILEVDPANFAQELINGIRVDHSMAVALFDYRHSLLSIRNISKLIRLDPGTKAFLAKRYDALISETKRVNQLTAPISNPNIAERKIFLHRLEIKYPYTFDAIRRNYYQGIDMRGSESFFGYCVRKILNGTKSKPAQGSITREIFNEAESNGIGNTAFMRRKEIESFALDGYAQNFLRQQRVNARHLRIALLYGNQLTPTRNWFKAMWQDLNLVLSTTKLGNVSQQAGRKILEWLEINLRPKQPAFMFSQYRKMSDTSLLDIFRIGRTRKYADDTMRALRGDEFVEQLYDSAKVSPGITYHGIGQNADLADPIQNAFHDLIELGRVNASDSRVVLLQQLNEVNMSPMKLKLIRMGREVGDRLPAPGGNGARNLSRWIYQQQLRGGLTATGLFKSNVIRLPIRTVERCLRGLWNWTFGARNIIGRGFYKTLFGKEHYWKYARWGLLGEMTMGTMGDLNAMDTDLSELLQGKNADRILLNRIRNMGSVLFLTPLASAHTNTKNAMAAFGGFNLLWSGGASTIQQMYELGSWDPRDVAKLKNLLATNSYANTSMLYGNIFEFPISAVGVPLQAIAQKVPFGQFLVAGLNRYSVNYLSSSLSNPGGAIDSTVNQFRSSLHHSLNYKAPTKEEFKKIRTALTNAKKQGVSHITMVASGIPWDQDYSGTFLANAEFKELEIVDPTQRMTFDDFIGYIGLTRKGLTNGNRAALIAGRDRFTQDVSDIRRGLLRLVNEKGATKEENFPDIKTEFDAKNQLDPYVRPVHYFEEQIKKEPTKYLLPIPDQFLAEVEKSIIEKSKERAIEAGLDKDKYDYLGQKIPPGIIITRSHTPSPSTLLSEDEIESLKTVFREYAEVIKEFWNNNFDWMLGNIRVIYKDYEENPFDDQKPFLKQVIFMGYHGNVLFVLGPDGVTFDQDKGFVVQTIEQKKDRSQFIVEDYFIRERPKLSNFPRALQQVPGLWRDPNRKSNPAPGGELSEEEMIKKIKEARESEVGYLKATWNWVGYQLGLIESKDKQYWEPKPYSWDPHTSLKAYMNTILWRISEEPESKRYQNVKRVRANWRLMPFEAPTADILKLRFTDFLERRWYIENFQLLDKKGTVLETIDWTVDRNIDSDPGQWLDQKLTERKQILKNIEKAKTIFNGLYSRLKNLIEKPKKPSKTPVVPKEKGSK